MTAARISASMADREKKVFLAQPKWYENPPLVYYAVAWIVAGAIFMVAVWP